MIEYTKYTSKYRSCSFNNVSWINIQTNLIQVAEQDPYVHSYERSYDGYILPSLAWAALKPCTIYEISQLVAFVRWFQSLRYYLVAADMNCCHMAGDFPRVFGVRLRGVWRGLGVALRRWEAPRALVGVRNFEALRVLCQGHSAGMAHGSGNLWHRRKDVF